MYAALVASQTAARHSSQQHQPVGRHHRHQQQEQEWDPILTTNTTLYSPEGYQPNRYTLSPRTYIEQPTTMDVQNVLIPVSELDPDRKEQIISFSACGTLKEYLTKGVTVSINPKFFSKDGGPVFAEIESVHMLHASNRCPFPVTMHATNERGDTLRFFSTWSATASEVNPITYQFGPKSHTEIPLEVASIKWLNSSDISVLKEYPRYITLHNIGHEATPSLRGGTKVHIVPRHHPVTIELSKKPDRIELDSTGDEIYMHPETYLEGLRLATERLSKSPQVDLAALRFQLKADTPGFEMSTIKEDLNTIACISFNLRIIFKLVPAAGDEVVALGVQP